MRMTTEKSMYGHKTKRIQQHHYTAIIKKNKLDNLHPKVTYISEEHVAKVSESRQSKSNIGAECNIKDFNIVPVFAHHTIDLRS